MIFQTANARYKYERETPEAQKRGDADQLPALAFAIDALVNAAGTQWYVLFYLLRQLPNLSFSILAASWLAPRKSHG